VAAKPPFPFSRKSKNVNFPEIFYGSKTLKKKIFGFSTEIEKGFQRNNKRLIKLNLLILI
jgi:hypothetical protein